LRIIACSILALSLSIGLNAKAFGNYESLAPDLVAPDVVAQSDAANDANANENSGSDVGGDSYPRVTSIETALLGKSFATDDLTARLVRLETKAFGKPSTNPDLGDRTDALQEYAEKKLGKKLFKEDPDFEAASNDAPPQQDYAGADQSQGGQSADYGNDPSMSGQVEQQQQDSSNGDYPHITELESAILKKAYPGEPVEDRLSRLERTAFGTASKDPDLSVRIDALDEYADKKLHFKSSQQQDERGQATSGDGGAGGGSPNRLRQVGTMVGTQLINMAGMGIPGALGFGGMRVRNRADLPASEQQEQSRAAEPQEDPVVLDTNPPPASAKLLTKVGWCEVRVFGHTFPSMHLPQRLAQLNTEIKFAPGKTGIALMDSTDSMIKTAASFKRESSEPSVSSSPGAQN